MKSLKSYIFVIQHQYSSGPMDEIKLWASDIMEAIDKLHWLMEDKEYKIVEVISANLKLTQ